MKLNDGVQFDHLASVYEEYTGKIAVENLRPSWLIFSQGSARATCSRSRSAASMSIAAFVGLVILAPVLVSRRDCRCG